MISFFWSSLLAFLMVPSTRRVVAMALAIVLAVVIVAPPARAQIGIPAVIAAATAVVSLIDNDIGGLLHTIQGTINSINSVLAEFNLFWSGVVYPPPSSNRARATVSSMIAQYRGLLTALMRVNVSSAQLANPAALESAIRSRGTGDFAQTTSAYIQTYRPIPLPTDAHPIERDLADIDDAMALANLKTLKASDAAVDQMMTAANVIEDEGTHMAPGSAAFRAGAGMIASVKSQATMQRMIAAAIRQEAARVAHDNTVRKRNAMFGAQFRTDVQTMFKK